MRGLLDTSAVIGERVEGLPEERAISTATLAELHFGVHMATTDRARRARLRRLAEIESRFDALPIDDAVARAYGGLAHAVMAAGRKPRARTMDILIAATAQANGVPLYTRDRADFEIFRAELDVRLV